VLPIEQHDGVHVSPKNVAQADAEPAFRNDHSGSSPADSDLHRQANTTVKRNASLQCLATSDRSTVYRKTPFPTVHGEDSSQVSAPGNRQSEGGSFKPGKMIRNVALASIAKKTRLVASTNTGDSTSEKVADGDKELSQSDEAIRQDERSTPPFDSGGMQTLDAGSTASKESLNQDLEYQPDSSDRFALNLEPAANIESSESFNGRSCQPENSNLSISDNAVGKSKSDDRHLSISNDAHSFASLSPTCLLDFGSIDFTQLNCSLSVSHGHYALRVSRFASLLNPFTAPIL